MAVDGLVEQVAGRLLPQQTGDDHIGVEHQTHQLAACWCRSARTAHFLVNHVLDLGRQFLVRHAIPHRAQGIARLQPEPFAQQTLDGLGIQQAGRIGLSRSKGSGVSRIPNGSTPHRQTRSSPAGEETHLHVSAWSCPCPPDMFNIPSAPNTRSAALTPR